MTLNEAIKIFTGNAEYERTHGSLQGCLDFKQLAEWLKELKQLRDRTKWMPVSERLPEEVDVLICNERGEIELSRGSYSTELNDCWIWYTSGWRFGDVIAWMPLPQPYKADKEVKADADSH